MCLCSFVTGTHAELVDSYAAAVNAEAAGIHLVREFLKRASFQVPLLSFAFWGW